MLLGNMPTTRAKSPIIEHKSSKYPEMRRNGLINGTVKINRITLCGTALVVIRHVESPSRIWVELTNNITHELTVTEPFDLKKANFAGAAPRDLVDNYYMAPRGERTYSRARVLAAAEIGDDSYVLVIFIDHGDVEWVNIECLADLPKNFEYHPWQAICLSLTDLEKKHHGRAKAMQETYWTNEDCELFADLISEYAEYNIRVLKGSVIRNDYREPLKVEMFGVDPVEQGVMLATYKKKPKGRNIACVFAGRSKGKVRYLEIDDASKYPFIIGTPPSKNLGAEEASNLPLFRRAFPENWIRQETSNLPFTVPRSEWDQWSINDVKVPYITKDYVHNNFYDELTSSYLVVVEGTCTQSPYEFYGRFFKRIHKEFTKEEKESFEPFLEAGGATLEEQQQLGDITWSMLKADDVLKDYARILDTFYGMADNRFMLEPDDVKRWLEMNTRVYAITNVPEERAMYTGEWQRVEVLAMDNFATVRYLDSGGSDTIAASNLYRIHSRHTRWHPLCAQFSLVGISDPEEEANKTWDMRRRRAFSAALRVDVPLMIGVLHHPNILRSREPNDKPFERDNVLFVEGARIMGDEKTLLETLFEMGLMLPQAIVVCGVSGSGKSTVGARLSELTGWIFKDGDDLHAPGSIAKMSRGEALIDTDRLPWLDAIVRFVELNNRTIIACSALKKIYRDILRRRLSCRFLLLDVERSVIEERLVGRRGHFMPVSLLDSQLSTLERPTAEETDMYVINITSRNESVENVSRRIKDLLGE